jgi:hypothetical protein
MFLGSLNIFSSFNTLLQAKFFRKENTTNSLYLTIRMANYIFVFLFLERVTDTIFFAYSAGTVSTY